MSYNYKLKLHQLLDERFYQAIEYWGWEINKKLIASQFTTAMKITVSFVRSNDYAAGCSGMHL